MSLLLLFIAHLEIVKLTITIEVLIFSTYLEKKNMGQKLRYLPLTRQSGLNDIMVF